MEDQMNAYVWKYIDSATDSYHSSGGVFAIAETETRARELAAMQGAKIAESETPDLVYVLADGAAPEVAVIFPNAGCC
jgi:hypothetical protein